MTILELSLLTVSCLALNAPSAQCWQKQVPINEPQVQAARVLAPVLTGVAQDVVLTAEAALVWDLASGRILFERQIDQRRPIASVTKLLSALTVRENLALSDVVIIPPEVTAVQAYGAQIGLPVGEHSTVKELLSASLIASANDAMLTLALAVAGSEEDFAALASSWGRAVGLGQTRAANSTGLSGGDQYSSARDVMRLMSLAYQDIELRAMLAAPKGVLETREGKHLAYRSTNKLVNTYVPIKAAKTGYTRAAGQNLVIITEGAAGQEIGAIILGSTSRFQDMKVLIEWIWRNYSW